MSDKYLDIPARTSVQLSENSRLISVIPIGTTQTAQEMLEKIYLACGLNPNDEAFTLECSPPQAVVSSIPSEMEGLRVAVFGLSPKQIGAVWTAPPYQWLKAGNHHWCFAERLEEIEADIEKKKLLWNCLKILKES